MQSIDITADRLISALFAISKSEQIAVLDSCGVGKTGSNLLIAGIAPVDELEIFGSDPLESLRIFDEKLNSANLSAIFTISYDFGLSLDKIRPSSRTTKKSLEPDIYIALFDCLVIHDYDNGRTAICGNSDRFASIADALNEFSSFGEQPRIVVSKQADLRSNFTKSQYLKAIDKIKELIQSGEIYQTNLTQQLSVELSKEMAAADIFFRLRRDHPSPFAAYIDRRSSQVVSASPEQFVRISAGGNDERIISASPIKGTSPRGRSEEEDMAFQAELLASEKDRAENIMIVDLMRNDLSRVCSYGSVLVKALCELEKHPTLLHLVSNVQGTLRNDATYTEIIKAIFPCGSITGAPKLRTMEIIEDIENTSRGLSMGAIGCRIPGKTFNIPEFFAMSVAIRTMVIRNHQAVFNVGGGVVIDSDPEEEFEESLLKAKALLTAMGIEQTKLG